jgi:hypothetical protein
MIMKKIKFHIEINILLLNQKIYGKLHDWSRNMYLLSLDKYFFEQFMNVSKKVFDKIVELDDLYKEENYE